MDTITRKEYMRGEFTHDQYYKQFVNGSIKQAVVSRIGFSKICNSKDEHFNDIPLKLWDCIPLLVTRQQLSEAGEVPTLSTAVCIAKRAAQQIRRENAQPELHIVRVKHELGEYDTEINGTVDGIFDYFKGQYINCGTDGDRMSKVTRVTFL